MPSLCAGELFMRRPPLPAALTPPSFALFVILVNVSMLEGGMTVHDGTCPWLKGPFPLLIPAADQCLTLRVRIMMLVTHRRSRTWFAISGVLFAPEQAETQNIYDTDYCECRRQMKSCETRNSTHPVPRAAFLFQSVYFMLLMVVWEQTENLLVT